MLADIRMDSPGRMLFFTNTDDAAWRVDDVSVDPRML
jgi:hypothetical protein